MPIQVRTDSTITVPLVLVPVFRDHQIVLMNSTFFLQNVTDHFRFYSFLSKHSVDVMTCSARCRIEKIDIVQRSPTKLLTRY